MLFIRSVFNMDTFYRSFFIRSLLIRMCFIKSLFHIVHHLYGSHFFYTVRFSYGHFLHVHFLFGPILRERALKVNFLKN
jgi:hypothetical protein